MFYDIIEYLTFCNETSVIYPFAIPYDLTTLGDIHTIEDLTNGNSDTETIHDSCLSILGKP